MNTSPAVLSDEARALLTLNLVPGLGSRLTRALLERFGSARVALSATPAELFEIPYLGRKVVDGMLATRDGKSTGAEIRDVLGGVIPLRKIFTKEQKAFFAAHAPAGIALDQLVPLGPTFILKLVWFPKELNRKFVAELWLYQDGSRILELSTKCLPAETFQVAAEARSYLSKLGVDVGGAQQTKTRTALEFFQAQLSAAAKPRRGPGRPRGSTTRGRTTSGARTTRSPRGRRAGTTAAASTATPSTAAAPATTAGTTGATPAPTATGRRRATTAVTKTTRAGAATRRAATPRKASTAKPTAAKPTTPKASAPKTGGTTRRTRRPSA